LGGSGVRRFTGIQLLLIFVAVNIVMFLMLVTAMTSEHPWLARVLPGQFGAGVNSSGYWVFFALVLLVNAVTVVIAGLVLVLPALRDGAHTDEKRLARHLADRGGLSEDSKESVLTALRDDVTSARDQIALGRLILAGGAVFMVLAFAAVSISFARAIPQGQMFVAQNATTKINADVNLNDVEFFTVDQMARGLLLDAPAIYDWRVSPLANNPKNMLFTNFVFAFRTLLGAMALLLLATAVRRRLSKPAEPRASPSPE